MFTRNVFFCLAISLVTLQQIALAASTFYIALAGASLAEGASPETIQYVIYFFGYALVAYILSSFAALCKVRASNQIWQGYTNLVLKETTSKLGYSSKTNKKNIIQWLNGEAASTIPQAAQFYVGYLSVILNIIFTICVFYFSVGLWFTLAIAFSLGVSTLMVLGLRKKIDQIAGKIQKSRLDMLVTVDSTWDRAAYGDSFLKNEGLKSLDTKANKYFNQVEGYTWLEQTVACLPIVLAVLVIVGMLSASDAYPPILIGTLVAILPRSLQLFGSIHSLSIYMSQYILINSKIRNLVGFVATLNMYDLSQSNESISIIDCSTGKRVSNGSFRKGVLNAEIMKGRFTIVGPNGSGKSTLLKFLKSLTDSSLLLAPDVSFIEPGEGSSTGQNRIEQLKAIFANPPQIIMLDEWDANLDSSNTKIIDGVLNDMMEKILVIEVRHKFAEILSVAKISS